MPVGLWGACMLPLGGRVIKMCGGGGITVLIYRMHNETTPGETGRLMAWTFEGWWSDKKFQGESPGPAWVNEGFSDVSCRNKQGGLGRRPDGEPAAI